MHRQKMKRRKDKRVFSATAIDRKKINTSPVIPRGGIRL